MNWNHFILLLTGLYLAYYAVNILADLCIKRKPPSSDVPDALFFAEDMEPELITYQEPASQANSGDPEKVVRTESLPAAEMDSSGADSLKELMRLAQNNLVEYTGSISY